MKDTITPLINVNDLDRSVKFYEGLGFKIERGGEEDFRWAKVISGDTALSIVPKDIVPPREQPADTQAWLKGELGKGVMLVFGVKEASPVWEKAQKIKAKVDSPLDKNPWGGTGFTVVDPDGYVVNISDESPM